MIFVCRASDGRAVVYYNEVEASKNGTPFSQFDVVPDGEGILMTDLNSIWWQKPEPIPTPPPTEVEQLRADVDFIALMQGVTL